MRFHVDCAIDVDASSLEEAMSKVELSVRDRETGELCNGHIGDAIDCGVDFSLMADKLIKSDFDVNGIEDLKEKIKEYVLEKILL